MDKTQSLHHLLTELIRTHDLEPKMLEQKVFVLWREHLSRSKHLAPLATNTVPISLSNGILKIYTEFPAYKSALSLDRAKIIADINAEFGKPVLTDFRIEIHPIRAAEPHKEETEDRSSSTKTLKENATIGNTPVAPEQMEKIEQTLASVSDTHLRESLWQLFTTQSKDPS